jgi:hypothetical protein
VNSSLGSLRSGNKLNQILFTESLILELMCFDMIGQK